MEYRDVDQWIKTFDINEIEPKISFKFLVLDKEGNAKWSESDNKIYDLNSIMKYLKRHKEEWETDDEIRIKSNQVLVLKYLRKEKEIVVMEDFQNYQDGRNLNIFDMQDPSKDNE